MKKYENRSYSVHEKNILLGFISGVVIVLLLFLFLSVLYPAYMDTFLLSFFITVALSSFLVMGINMRYKKALPTEVILDNSKVIFILPYSNKLVVRYDKIVSMKLVKKDRGTIIYLYIKGSKYLQYLVDHKIANEIYTIWSAYSGGKYKRGVNE